MPHSSFSMLSESLAIVRVRLPKHQNLYSTPPNNMISDIVKKGYLFFVTIENTVTGDKQTISNRNKKYLIWDANNIAYKFYNKERGIIK